MKKKIYLLMGALVLLGFPVILGAQRTPDSETKPLLAILDMVNLSEDTSLDNLSESSMDTLESTLRFMNLYTIRRARHLQTGRKFSKAKPYLIREGYLYAIYGEMEKRASGGYLMRVNIWDAAENKIVLTREAAAESVFDVFDIMDALAIDVVSSFTGQKVAFGLLEVENTGAPGRYAVYVDDQLIGDDVTRQKLLFGDHEVRVTVPTGLGERVVHTETVTIEEGTTTRVSFALIDRGEAGEAADIAAVDAVDLGRGSLELTGSPPGAAVALSGQEAGLLPLDLYGLQAGYHPLTITAPGFYPAEGVVKILPDETVTADYSLILNLDDPLVKGELYSPGGSALWAGGGKAVPLIGLWGLTLIQGGGRPLLSDYVGYSPLMGQFAAGNPLLGAALSSMTPLAGSLFYGKTYDDGFWNYDNLLIITMLTVSLLDIILAPIMAVNNNTRLKKKFQEQGVDPRDPLKDSGWFLCGGAGGGDLVHLGLGYHFTPHWAYSQEVGWVTDMVLEESRNFHAVNTTGKIMWYPYRNKPVDVYLGALWHTLFNGDGLGGGVGLLSGLAWRLGDFTLKGEVDGTYGLRSGLDSFQFLLGGEWAL